MSAETIIGWNELLTAKKLAVLSVGEEERRAVSDRGTLPGLSIDALRPSTTLSPLTHSPAATSPPSFCYLVSV